MILPTPEKINILVDFCILCGKAFETPEEE
jgi:hypothetical protein